MPCSSLPHGLGAVLNFFQPEQNASAAGIAPLRQAVFSSASFKETRKEIRGWEGSRAAAPKRAKADSRRLILQ